MYQDESLDIPNTIMKYKSKKEILRLWKSDSGLHVNLSVDPTEDPISWGIKMVDLVRHIANSYHLQTGHDFDEMLTRVKASFDSEWSSTPDDV